MNTQVRTFAADMALPGAGLAASRRSTPQPAVGHVKHLPNTAFVSGLRVARGVLQLAGLGIGIPAGLVLVLITVAKDQVSGLIETSTAEKQP